MAINLPDGSNPAEVVTPDAANASEVRDPLGNTVWTASVELTTDSTLNGGSMDVTVYEDTNGDGTAENQETVTLSGGAETFELGNLSGLSGSDYWARSNLTPGSITTSPILHSIDLEVLSDPWNEAAEWDNAQSENNVVHENYTDLSAVDVQVGYPSYMDNLVGYYPLDEASGAGTAYDYANGNDGSIAGNVNPAVSGGILNKTRAEFNGGETDDYIDLGSPSALQLTGSMTISAWVEARSFLFIITTWANNYIYYPFHIKFNNDGTLKHNTSDGAADSTYSMPSNTLTHVVTARDSNGDVYFWWDGEPDSGNPFSVGASPNDGDGHCTIGRDGTQKTDGYLGDVMYFNTKLSDSQVQDLYDRTNNGGHITTGVKTSA